MHSARLASHESGRSLVRKEGVEPTRPFGQDKPFIFINLLIQTNVLLPIHDCQCNLHAGGSMRAKIALIARVKDSSRASGYRLDTVRIKKGRPVAIPNSTTFYLRYQSGAKRVMKPVGSDLEIAFVAYENHTRNFDSLQRGESITDPLGEQENGTTLSDALEQYAGQLHGKSAATQYQYRAVLEEFVKFCGENAAVQKIGRQQLLDYKASLYEQDLSETTRHNRLLRAVMFLKQFGIEKPLKKPDWPQPNQRTVEAYSQDEISTLFGVATFEEKLLLEFFLVSGARDL